MQRIGGHLRIAISGSSATLCPTTMKLQHFLASTLTVPMAICLMVQPLSAGPAMVAPTVPEIDVQQPVGRSLEDGNSKVSCGTSVIGISAKAKKFTIKNIGNGKLTGLTVTRNGVNAREFRVVQAARTSLMPGTSTTFTVTFKPAGRGTRSAAIHIKSNDADEASFDIVLTGKGQ